MKTIFVNILETLTIAGCIRAAGELDRMGYSEPSQVLMQEVSRIKSLKNQRKENKNGPYPLLQ